MKSRNLVRGYMHLPGVEYKESFSSVATDTPTMILIGLNLYHKEEGWVSQLFYVEAELLNPNITVDMFIKWPEGIMDLGIIMNEFLEEYCILIGKSMYGNVDADILLLRFLATHLINKCNPKRSKTES